MPPVPDLLRVPRRSQLASCPQGLQLPVPLLTAGIAMGTAHLPLASAAGLCTGCTAPVGACTPPKLLGGVLQGALGNGVRAISTKPGDFQVWGAAAGAGMERSAPPAISRGDYFCSSVFLN